MTLRTGSCVWAVVLALSLGATGSLWAEDQPAVVEQAPVVEQPAVVASPPQPVVENPAFREGVYDLSGNYLGANMEEAQPKIQAQAQARYWAEHQAKIDAFQATHPDPGDGSGFRDMRGNFMGRNTAEAAAAGFVADPTSPEEIQKEIQRHGTENIYFNKETGDWVTFGSNGKHGVTREEFLAGQEQNLQRMSGEEMRATMRQGRGQLGPQVDAQMDATLKQAEQFEKEGMAELAKEKERLQKLIPRVLISVEKPQGNEQK